MAICGQESQITNQKSSIQFLTRVVPRASKAGIAGTRAGALLVRLQSAPVEGAANEELIQMLAKAFGVAKRDVDIAAGERAKVKRVAITTLDRRHFELVLESLEIDPQDLKVSSS